MGTYKIEFNNGKKFKLVANNLDETHTKVVNYINNNNLVQCMIMCPNGVVRRVRKTGSQHWNHNGFEFD